MKIDTEIQHVTKSGANLFLELGFTPAEAKRLQAASRKQINDTQLLKQQLMAELSVWISEHHLKQAEAAEILISEDLDFAGGIDFSGDSMGRIKHCIETRIGERFDLNVTVDNKPAKGFDGEVKHVRVDKWWISIETAPENPAMPRQKIKLEIANIPAYTRELTPLRINYDFLGGSPTVLINAESLDEINADKVLAFPTSLLDNAGKPVSPDSAKIMHRDIWDLAWMATRGAKLVPGLVAAKISDYGVENYPGLLDQAIKQLPEIVKSREFKAQMSRFIDSTTLAKKEPEPKAKPGSKRKQAPGLVL